MNPTELIDLVEKEAEIETFEYNINECKQKLESVRKQVSLNILHMNIRSINKNFDELLLLIHTLDVNNIDIIILSETWQIITTKNYNIPEFRIYYNDSKLNQNDGMIIYIKTNILANVTQEKYQNITITKTDFKFNDNDICITSLYRSPSSESNLFLTDLETHFKKYKNNKSIEIFIGDVNLNLLKTNDGQVNNYINYLGGLGYKSYINKATRVTNDNSSCIDHIFVKKQQKSKDSLSPIILKTSITDHYTTLLNICSEEKMLQKCECKIIKKIEENLLLYLLEKETWLTVLNTDDPEISCNNFVSVLKNHITFSTKEIKLKNKSKKLKPWITQGIINSIKTRDKLKLKARSDKNVELFEKYKRYRNILNNLIKNAKNQYYKSQIILASNDGKKIWDLIKDATNMNEKCLDTINITNDDGQIILDDKAKANFFNTYFLNVGVKMASKISNVDNNLALDYENLPYTMFLNPVTEEELTVHIASLKNKSSAGMDGITSLLLKKIHKFILIPLKHIINSIFITGKVPSHFKLSCVTPIYKAGSRTDKANYRPISVISNLAKIFEKCMKQRLMEFLEKYKILSQSQFGFRKARSTEMAIHELVENINNNFNDDRKCIAIFLDLAKAFDTVSHNILLNRMQSLGIRGLSYDILKNYLEDRKQFVKINDKLSDAGIIKIGVPQGTVLGPILFLIYINSLTLLQNQEITIISYADDTVLVFSDTSWEKVNIRASIGLCTVKKWLDHNLLTLNLKKTKFIAFSPSAIGSNSISHLTLHENNCKNNQNKEPCGCKTKIDAVKHIQYLGIMLDQHLRWKQHTEKIARRLRSLIPVFYQLRNILSISQLVTVYKALVESIIRYGIIIWGGLYNSALNSLNVAQNYIIKIMLKKEKRYPTCELYNESKIYNIKLLYVLQSIIFIHTKFDKSYIDHSYITRDKLNIKLEQKFFKKSLCQRYVTFTGPKFYNELPLSIRIIQNKRKFIIEVKKHISRNKDKFQNL